jgi:predicted ATPase
MCFIVKEESKQIILVTHSETLVSSLLVAIKEKIIRPGDVKLYLTKKDKKATVFSEQKVNHKGQVEGGLTSFVEGELEDLRIMLGEQA